MAPRYYPPEEDPIIKFIETREKRHKTILKGLENLSKALSGKSKTEIELEDRISELEECINDY